MPHQTIESDLAYFLTPQVSPTSEMCGVCFETVKKSKLAPIPNLSLKLEINFPTNGYPESRKLLKEMPDGSIIWRRKEEQVGSLVAIIARK
jgi:hypothetical protein